MEWKHAFKSGAVAGALYGMIAGAIGVAYMILDKENVMSIMQASIPSGASIPISMDQLYNIALIASFPSSVIMGMIAGLAFGVVFMLLKDELIGKTLKMRGVVLGLLMFAALGLAEIAEPSNAIGAFFLIKFSYLPLVPVAFVGFLAFGYFQGIFWERMEDKHGKR